MARWPLKLGLVRLDAEPGVVCFVADAAATEDVVIVRTNDGGPLAASGVAPSDGRSNLLRDDALPRFDGDRLMTVSNDQTGG